MSVKFHQKAKLKAQKWIDSGALQNAKLKKKNSKNGQIFLHLIFNVYPCTEG
jgi:hypothetical protein